MQAKASSPPPMMATGIILVCVLLASTCPFSWGAARRSAADVSEVRRVLRPRRRFVINLFFFSSLFLFSKKSLPKKKKSNPEPRTHHSPNPLPVLSTSLVLQEEDAPYIYLRAATIEVPSGIERKPSPSSRGGRQHDQKQEGARRRRLTDDDETTKVPTMATTPTTADFDSTPGGAPPLPLLLPPPPTRWWGTADDADQYLVHLRPPVKAAARESLLHALVAPPNITTNIVGGEGGSPPQAQGTPLSSFSTSSSSPAPAAEGVIAGYVPLSSYLVIATPAAMARVAELPAVTWSGRMKPSHKVAPDLLTAATAADDGAAGGDVPGRDAAATAVLVRDLDVRLPPVEGVNVTAAMEDAREVLQAVFLSFLVSNGSSNGGANGGGFPSSLSSSSFGGGGDNTADAAVKAAAAAAAATSIVAVPSSHKIMITVVVPLSPSQPLRPPRSPTTTAKKKTSSSSSSSAAAAAAAAASMMDDRALFAAVITSLSSRPWAHWIERRRREASLFNMQTSSVIQTGRGVGAGAGAGAGAGGDGPEDGRRSHPQDVNHRDNPAGESGGGGHPVWSVGLRGEGQLVGVGDSGLDLSSCWLRDPAGRPPGPDHRKVHAYNSAYGDDIDGNGHGTHVVSSILGDASVAGMSTSGGGGGGGGDEASESLMEKAADAYNGMAPAARVVFTDIGTGRGGVLYLPTSMERYYSLAYDAGARVHSDSWGNDVPLYDGLAREVDEFVWRHRDFLPIFAAGNFGGEVHASSTVTSPSTCKNGMSVGRVVFTQQIRPLLRSLDSLDSLNERLQ